MPKEPDFDVALSFAGEDRAFVDRVANILRDKGVKVFYDLFEEANLWGKNLYDYLTDIYKDKALYTIMFVSAPYARKVWTTHERQAMQARAFQESREYILPARFDETEIPGLLPTTGYISLTHHTPESFAEVVMKKLVHSGRTIPSASVRRSLFATTLVPRVDPLNSRITVLSAGGEAIPGASVTAIADNNTTKEGSTDVNGIATLTIGTRRRYQLLVAHPQFGGALIPFWDPKDDVTVTLTATENVGSITCHGTCYIPGLEGRLSPILDTSHRTYLYAGNIAINGGKQQPVTFTVNEPIELEDCNGVLMEIRVLHIQGSVALIQYVKPRYDA